MAEVAAGAVVAEEVVTNVAYAGVGAYMVAKPTMPLKATFTRIANSKDDDSRLSLTRCGHTLTLVGNNAYIFGGETAIGQLASNDVNVVTLPSSEKPEPEFATVSAVPEADGAKVPSERKQHAACASNQRMAMFGGVDATGQVINENFIWMFNTGRSKWEDIPASNPDVAPKPRSSAHLLGHENSLVLYGGSGADGESLKDVWHFDGITKTWSELPEAPVSSSHAALSDGVLYVVSGEDNMSSDLHLLPIATKDGDERSWNTIPFPTNPLTPGPLPRTAAGLLPISTGYGRQYLVYFFGAQSLPQGGATESTESPIHKEESKDTPPLYKSDMWTYQLPSSNLEVKATTNIYEAIKPANIKDKIRGALGFDDGKHSWVEVEVLPPTDLEASEGKVHPGPRGSFACDVMDDGTTVVVWGGVNPKGEREGDGWVIKLE